MELLTKLEELVLIAVLKLGENAYGISIYEFVAGLTGRDVSVSSVYFPLERLVRKGCLRCRRGRPTARRGGMSKRYYRLTPAGVTALEENRSLNQATWRGVAALLRNNHET